MKSTRMLVGAGISGLLALGGVGLAHAAVDDPADTAPAVEVTTDDTTTDDTTTDDTTTDDTTTDDTTAKPMERGRHGGRGGGADGASDGTGDTGTSASDPDADGTVEPETTEDSVPADDL